jgi:hypothetical protein
MLKFFRHNGLSLTFLVLFFISITGQTYFGFQEYNKERTEQGEKKINLGAYFNSGHFIESTFENWESEFLQMGLFVWLTIFLFQKGSSESKKCDEDNEVDHEPDPRKKDAPWPVKKGGFILALYKHSLTISLLLLFILSLLLHFYGSLRDENEHNLVRHLPVESVYSYMGSSRFWFESFQNWQSEFLSVFAIIVFSIYLRQKGSSQSKAVDAPHHQTGEK